MAERSSWVGPGLLLVLATALISGVSTFVNAYAVQGTNSAAFVSIRNIVVAAAILPIALVAARYLRAPRLARADWLRLGVIGLIGGAIPFLLFFQGLQMATAAGGAVTAAFAYRTLFLWATVLAVFYLRERFDWRVVLGAGLLLGGSALLLSWNAPVWTDGTAYVLAATVMWAVEYTISKKALGNLPSSTVMLGRMGFGGAFLAAYLALTAQWSAVAGFSGPEWTWVAISAAFLGVFVGTWYTGLKRVSLSVATSALVLGFPVTWLLGVLVQGHPISTEASLGALAIVAGVAVVIGLSQFREIGRFLARTLRPTAAST